MSKVKSGPWAVLSAVGVAACLAAPLSLAAPAWAQTPPASGDMHARHAEHMADRLEDHARKLRAILNLRPDQEPALQTFLAAMKPPMEPARMGPGAHDEMGMNEHHDRGEERRAMQQMTTPQRLDKMAEMMTRRQAEFQRRADAIRAFYAALRPEQQRAFDALPPMMMRHGGHKPWGEGRGPGHMGPTEGQ